MFTAAFIVNRNPSIIIIFAWQKRQSTQRILSKINKTSTRSYPYRKVPKYACVCCVLGCAL